MEFCRKKMAPYKKPKSVDFISLTEMPMSGGSYKILKRVLKDRYREKSKNEHNKKEWGAV